MRPPKHGPDLFDVFFGIFSPHSSVYVVLSLNTFRHAETAMACNPGVILQTAIK